MPRREQCCNKLVLGPLHRLATSARPRGPNVSAMPEQLTVERTRTGYWVVKRGRVDLAGALTREAAEAERELIGRLGDRASDVRESLRERPPAHRHRRR